MILQDILKQIDINSPNSLPVGIKIGFVNEIQRQLFRDYPTPEASYAFITNPIQQLYPMPTDLAEDRVTMVEVGNTQYNLISRDEDSLEYHWWTIINGHLMLNPAPTNTLLSYVHYKPRPYDLTVSDMAESPSFPEDYHELLVLGGTKRTLLSQNDPEQLPLVRYYDEEFMRLAEKANRDLRKVRNKRVRILRTWE